MARVWLQLRTLKQWPPILVGRYVLGRGSINGRPSWGVALEVRRVQLEPAYGTGCAQPDGRPIIAGPASSLGFPPIAHMCGSAGQKQVLRLAVEHVTAAEDGAAVLDCDEIELTARAQLRPVGLHDAKHAQSG